MSQPCAFVDPSSLSLPSSSSNRLPSPACSTDDSTPGPSTEPPRKRPRSAVTPEERKEARAHRNRIAAQNSRDRRKAQFAFLERRVAELEDENRRLRAGILAPSSISTVPLPDISSVECEQEQQRKREEEQRERENQELRERIRTLEKGYEAVVRALAAQGNLSVASGIPTPPTTSPAPTVPSHSQPSQSASTMEPSEAPSSSSSPSLLLSPTSSSSTLESPLLFTSGDSFDISESPAFPVSDTLPQESLNLSLTNVTSTRHLARVANTVDHPAVPLQRVGDVQMVMGLLEDEAASDAVITRLFAEILASPPLGSSTLPSSRASSEDAFSKEMLTTTETNPSDLGLGKSSVDTVDWAERARAEMEMEKLLDMLPNVQDVAVDAILNSSASLDVDMDFSCALTWDGVSVF